jgi:selenocysteine lyase/cysteine desulfurase
VEINLDFIRNEIIGNNLLFDTPYGKRLITYTDYTASGRTLAFIEKYMIKIQEMYGNTHTEDSYTGKTMTGLLHKAEKNIKHYVGATERNYIFPVGTGTTGAVAKLCEIIGLYLTPGLKYKIDEYVKQFKEESRYKQEIIEDLFKNMSEKKPIVFVSPYEHHSNYLIWKETFAEVIEIRLNKTGCLDLLDLETKLKLPEYSDRIKIGSFSAASNITGVKTDVYEVARILHRHNALAFFDFAACAPYVEINMNLDNESYFDAIFFSPHKFIGGPGSSGILLINKDLYSNLYPPTVAGGGTVSYVSPFNYMYSENVEEREKAGTPGILQIIKASLALELKQLIGTNKINEIEKTYFDYALNKLENQPNIIIYGHKECSKKINILSFNIKHENKFLHHKLVAKLLNDLFGIQSRAGCACAGPYGHRLLGLDKEFSQKFESAVRKGVSSLKPGFVRINFHYLMSQEEIDFILNAIIFIANYGNLFLSQYVINLKTGSWNHLTFVENNQLIDNFGILDSFNYHNDDVFKQTNINKSVEYNNYIDQAIKEANSLYSKFVRDFKVFENPKFEEIRWFNFINC